MTSRLAIGAIRAANGWRACYDLVFVDPYHSYECSSSDLTAAFTLLRPGGIMVIHDCNPPNMLIAMPTFHEGEWCGVTYWAFIDFVLRRWDAGFLTVDTDSGCGVIYKQPIRNLESRAARAALRHLAESWRTVRDDDTARFDFFDRHRRDLLNLKSVDEFLAG